MRLHHYFICCEGPNMLSPDHERDPATVERVEGMEKEKRLHVDFADAALLQGRAEISTADFRGCCCCDDTLCQLGGH